MRRMALCVIGAVLLAVFPPDSIHADQGLKASGQVPGQGLRWARSAVTPFQTWALDQQPANRLRLNWRSASSQVRSRLSRAAAASSSTSSVEYLYEYSV